MRHWKTSSINPRSILKVALVAGALALGTVAAEADARAACSTISAAEMVRLRAEMFKLAAKNAHSGAVSTFRKMLDLSKSKCELKRDDYVAAANSARNLGDIATAISWFTAGGDSAGASDLKARFAQVKIKERPGDLIRAGGMPFAPDERAALDAAIKGVKARGAFTGYLPLGTYKIGAKSFEVTTSGMRRIDQ